MGANKALDEIIDRIPIRQLGILEKLHRYEKIVVCGPQRAGTRIATKIISKYTNHRNVDETDFKIHDEGLFFSYLEREGRDVIQAPGMTHCIGEYYLHNESICTVFCYRDLRAILESQARIDWNRQAAINEGKKYPATLVYPHFPIALKKFQLWEKLIKPGLKKSQYAEWYYSYNTHFPEWVPKDKRANFKPNQTEV